MGCGIGLFYFAGLWWTVQRLPKSNHPGFLALSSLGIRMAGMILGFLLVARGGRWQQLLLALLGVIAVRFVLVHRVRSGRKAETA
jgi:F1F0 ATPase subunit 2